MMKKNLAKAAVSLAPSIKKRWLETTLEAVLIARREWKLDL